MAKLHSQLRLRPYPVFLSYNIFRFFGYILVYFINLNGSNDNIGKRERYHFSLFLGAQGIGEQL